MLLGLEIRLQVVLVLYWLIFSKHNKHRLNHSYMHEIDVINENEKLDYILSISCTTETSATCCITTIAIRYNTTVSSCISTTIDRQYSNRKFVFALKTIVLSILWTACTSWATTQSAVRGWSNSNDNTTVGTSITTNVYENIHPFRLMFSNNMKYILSIRWTTITSSTTCHTTIRSGVVNGSCYYCSGTTVLGADTAITKGGTTLTNTTSTTD